MANTTKHYLLKVIGDVEPELEGPLADADAVLAAARAHRAEDPNMVDGLFRLTVTATGEPAVEGFAGAELDVDEAEGADAGA